MSSTNKTDNYQLSQFVGSDIPSILNDYNGDMRKIDTAIHNATIAGGDNATAISELRASTNRISTELGGVSATVNALSGRVVGIEEVIPATASEENKVATVADVAEVQEELDDVSADVKAIQLCVPASASEDNKLATMEDIPSGGNSVKVVTISKAGHATYQSLLNAVRAKIVELGLFDNFGKIIGVEESGYCYYTFSGIGDDGSNLHFTARKDSVNSGIVNQWIYEVMLSGGASQKYDYLTAISTSGASNYTITDDTNSTPLGNFKLYYFE